LFSAGRARLA